MNGVGSLRLVLAEPKFVGTVGFSEGTLFKVFCAVKIKRSVDLLLGRIRLPDLTEFSAVLLHEDISRKARHTVAAVLVVKVRRDLQQAVLSVYKDVVLDDVVLCSVARSAATPLDVRAPSAVDGRSLLAETARRIPHMVALDTEIRHHAGVIGLTSAYEILDGIHAVFNDVVEIQDVGMVVNLVPHPTVLMRDARVVDLINVVVLNGIVLTASVNLHRISKSCLVISSLNRA